MTQQQIERKLLGEILQEAGLVSAGQVEVALREQLTYPQLRIGEILVLHGWISRETVNFFTEIYVKAANQSSRKKLGFYLCQAGFLTENQVKDILSEQVHTKIRFGSLAVGKGLIKQQTLDFLLKYLFPESMDNNPRHYGYNEQLNPQRETLIQKETIAKNNQLCFTAGSHKTEDLILSGMTTLSSYQKSTEEVLEKNPWFD